MRYALEIRVEFVVFAKVRSIIKNGQSIFHQHVHTKDGKMPIKCIMT